MDNCVSLKTAKQFFKNLETNSRKQNFWHGRQSEQKNIPELPGNVLDLAVFSLFTQHKARIPTGEHVEYFDYTEGTQVATFIMINTIFVLFLMLFYTGLVI